MPTLPKWSIELVEVRPAQYHLKIVEPNGDITTRPRVLGVIQVVNIITTFLVTALYRKEPSE